MSDYSFKVIIPARGDSKGLPRKNILPLNSKPLILYTLDAAKAVFNHVDIHVSTDSEEIKQVAEDSGITINRLRPKNLAKDDSPVVDVLLDYLKNDLTEIPDFIVLLQPTSPLRNAVHIREALSLVNESIDMVVSCTISDYNPYWNLFEESDNGYLNKIKKADYSRRQDIPPVYFYNGAIYIINTKSLLSLKSLNFHRVVKYLMDKKFAIDIDDEIDFMVAENLISKKCLPKE